MVQKTLNWFDRFKLFVEPRYVIVRNIAVTFIQGGFAVWAANGFAMDKLSIGAAAGAGFSAVWNLIVKPWLIQHGYMKA